VSSSAQLKRDTKQGRTEADSRELTPMVVKTRRPS
jgi:hypothetical protein